MKFSISPNVDVTVPSTRFDRGAPFLLIVENRSPGPVRLGVQFLAVTEREITPSSAGPIDIPPSVDAFEAAFIGNPGYEGLHLLVLSEGVPGEGTPIFQRSRFELPVWVANEEEKSSPDPSEKYQAAIRAQEDYQKHPIFADGYSGPAAFEATFFIEKCLLDFSQIIEGGVIIPLPYSLSTTSYVEAVNRFSSLNPRFPISEQMEAEFGADHPLTVVIFRNVVAPDRESVLEALAARLGLICGILSSERGATPRPFAWVSYEHGDSGAVLSFLRSAYTGNLLGGWEAGKITKLLSEYIEATRKDPWVELLLSMQREVIAEKNPLFRVFRAWGMLEACAKRRPLPGFDELPNHKGVWTIESVEVRGKDLAKVCYYVASELGATVGYANREYQFSALADVYRIRNIAAHEGALKPAETYSDEVQRAIRAVLGPMPHTALDDWCRASLERERRRALEDDARS